MHQRCSHPSQNQVIISKNDTHVQFIDLKLRYSTFKLPLQVYIVLNNKTKGTKTKTPFDRFYEN